MKLEINLKLIPDGEKDPKNESGSALYRTNNIKEIVSILSSIFHKETLSVLSEDKENIYSDGDFYLVNEKGNICLIEGYYMTINQEHKELALITSYEVSQTEILNHCDCIAIGNDIQNDKDALKDYTLCYCAEFVNGAWLHTSCALIHNEFIKVISEIENAIEEIE